MGISPFQGTFIDKKQPFQRKGLYKSSNNANNTGFINFRDFHIADLVVKIFTNCVDLYVIGRVAGVEFAEKRLRSDHGKEGLHGKGK